MQSTGTERKTRIRYESRIEIRGRSGHHDDHNHSPDSGGNIHHTRHPSTLHTDIDSDIGRIVAGSAVDPAAVGSKTAPVRAVAVAASAVAPSVLDAPVDAPAVHTAAVADATATRTAVARATARGQSAHPPTQDMHIPPRDNRELLPFQSIC